MIVTYQFFPLNMFQFFYLNIFLCNNSKATNFWVYAIPTIHLYIYCKSSFRENRRIGSKLPFKWRMYLNESIGRLKILFKKRKCYSNYMVSWKSPLPPHLLPGRNNVATNSIKYIQIFLKSNILILYLLEWVQAVVAYNWSVHVRVKYIQSIDQFYYLFTKTTTSHSWPAYHHSKLDSQISRDEFNIYFKIQKSLFFDRFPYGGVVERFSEFNWKISWVRFCNL